MSRPRLTPNRYAFYLALAHLATALVWIHFSTWAVGLLATSVDELRHLEVVKGIAFSVVMSSAFFLFSRAVYAKIRADSERLLQTHQRLLQAERQAIAGMLASAVAHDFSNVLTVMRLNLSRLESQLERSGEAVGALAKIDSGLVRLTELTHRLRLTGREPLPKQPATFFVDEAVAETLGFLKTHKTVQACTIVVEKEERVALVGQPILVHQLVMNLILNAAEATEGRGTIRVRLARERDGATIEVHDDGPGVPEDQREAIFDVFHTTKPSGSGLGLLSVNSCVAIHRGSVVVKTSPLGGALFEVYLPDLEPSLNAQHKTSESLNKITLDRVSESASPAGY